RLLRRAFGLDFEVQVLVIAELVGTAYYRVMLRSTRDPVLEQVCELFLRDEAKHVEFHTERLAVHLAEMLPVERAAWKAQFQGVFLAAMQAAWLDHRECLAALGASRREFVHEARAECVALLDRADSLAAGSARPSRPFATSVD